MSDQDSVPHSQGSLPDELDSGDHNIFLGEVLSGKVSGKGQGLQFRLTDYLDAVANPEGPVNKE